MNEKKIIQIVVRSYSWRRVIYIHNYVQLCCTFTAMQWMLFQATKLKWHEHIVSAENHQANMINKSTGMINRVLNRFHEQTDESIATSDEVIIVRLKAIHCDSIVGRFFFVFLFFWPRLHFNLSCIHSFIPMLICLCLFSLSISLFLSQMFGLFLVFAPNIDLDATRRAEFPLCNLF